MMSLMLQQILSYPVDNTKSTQSSGTGSLDGAPFTVRRSTCIIYMQYLYKLGKRNHAHSVI